MTTAAELQTVVTVPARFRGPEGVANGGWIAGTVSEALHGARHDSAVEVTLHAPTPLDTRVAICAISPTPPPSPMVRTCWSRPSRWPRS